MSQRLQTAIEERVARVKEYVTHPEYVRRFAPEDMAEAVTCYFASGGKRLRPAVMLFSVGAVGGDEEKAISAAAAVEIFHTWTLVHDDIIDRDEIRRGAPTVHHRFAIKPSTKRLFGDDDESRHYGVSVAVLAGDVQHGWGISLMTELTTRYGLSSQTTLKLIDTLDTRVLCTLVEGEMLDVQYSRLPVESLTVEQIERMLWMKTGALYEFCGEAGAAIGLDTPDLKHPLCQALARFCSACGSAFQLQDDVLGIVGDEKVLGKPVGSDIREGKRTVIVRHAFENADLAQRKQLSSVLGNAHATAGEIQDAIHLLVNLGGIEFTIARAKEHVGKAVNFLIQLPPSPYRDLLGDWADLMINRTF